MNMFPSCDRRFYPGTAQLDGGARRQGALTAAALLNQGEKRQEAFLLSLAIACPLTMYSLLPVMSLAPRWKVI
jgi:hypothetical protein